MLDERVKFLHDREINYLYIGLYGSQNYGLDTDKSDYDYKVLCVPSYSDALLGYHYFGKRNTTKTYEFNNGIMVCSDFRKVFDEFVKGSINNLEFLYTENYSYPDKYLSYIHYLRTVRDEICNNNLYNISKCAKGMIKNINRQRKHNEKDIINIVRLTFFLKKLDETHSFEEALTNSMEESILQELKEYKMVLHTKGQINDDLQAAQKFYKDIEYNCSINQDDDNVSVVRHLLDNLAIEILTREKYLR